MPAPIGLTVTPSETKITIQWQDNSDDETGFSVYRQEVDSSTDFERIAGVAANVERYEDTAVDPGTRYRYGVTADKGGRSSKRLVASEEPVVLENHPPIATAQTLSTPEDTPLTFTLSGRDVDGDALTFAVVDAPSKGRLAGSPPHLTYTPAPNISGEDTFTFTASDGALTSPPETVTIRIGDVNDVPVAYSRELSAEAGQRATVTLAGYDAEGDDLTFDVVEEPSKGRLSSVNRATGEVIYIPEGEEGTDNFTFVVSDGASTSAEAVVTVNLGIVNNVPVAQAQEVEIDEDEAVAITLTATDSDSDEVQYAVLGAPAHGTLKGAAPNLTYTPSQNYYGADRLTFRANDGYDDSDIMEVTLTVREVNDAPRLTRDLLDQRVSEDKAFRLDIRVNFSDVDAGDSLSYDASLRGNNANGGDLPAWLSLEDGVLSGTPGEGDAGSFEVSVTATDTSGLGVTDSFTLSVRAVNDAPTAITLSNNTIGENQPARTLVGVLSSADVDSATFIYSLAPGEGGADNRSFIIDGDELKTAARFDFEAKNTYRVRVRSDDGAGGTFARPLTVKVENVDDVAPEITFAKGDTPENKPLQLELNQPTVLKGTVKDKAISSVTLFAGSTSLGTATLEGEAWRFTYTPRNAGRVTLKVIATDAAGNEAERRVEAQVVRRGTGRFAFAQVLPSADSTSVALGDLDNDGDLDIFEVNNGPSQIYLNRGDASFLSTQGLVSVDSRNVALGDLDKDGDLDAVEANGGASRVYLNNGDGTFLSGHVLADADSRGVALGDFNKDGSLDVLEANSGVSRIYFNKGNATFRPGPVFPEADGVDVAVGDFDKDGDLDVLEVNKGQSRIYLNKGKGGFKPGHMFAEADSVQVAVGHLNKDDKLDIVEVDGQGVQVYLNNGNATFRRGQGLSSLNSTGVALGDLDNDGDLDALTANGSGSSQVFLNGGDATFSAFQGLGFADSRGVALGDLDGDRALDVLEANSGFSHVYLSR